MKMAKYMYGQQGRWRSLNIKVAKDIKEAMIEGRFAGNPLAWIFDQHHLDKIDTRLAHYGERVSQKVGLLIFDHLEGLSFFLGCEG